MTLKTTINNILTGKITIPPSYRLYVVREEDTVFYVGQSVDIESRIKAHVGEGEGVHGLSGPSSLGNLINRNRPESLRWRVELWRPEEVFGADIQDIVDVTERALIDFYKPVLNSQGNPEPSEMPAKYKAQAEEGQIRAVRAAFGETGDDYKPGRI